jgi:hypothetical protein
MVRLNTRDASVLARVAQYDKLSTNRQEALLDTLHGDAREIGEVIVRRKAASSKDVKSAADRIKTWAQRNRERRRYRTSAK